MTSEREKMLPCPFCGSRMELRGDYTRETAWNYFEHADAIDSRCIMKDHKINAPDFRTPDLAEATEWNTRIPALSAERALAKAREALRSITELYCDLANSGDAGFWNPEDVEQVKQARAALSQDSTP